MMKVQVQIQITTPDGQPLTTFLVDAPAGFASLPDPEGVALEHLAAQVQDQVRQRFEISYPDLLTG
jgi:hypothetical protein